MRNRLILGLLLAVAACSAAWAAQPALSLHLLLPGHLSALEDTEAAVFLVGSADGPAQLLAAVASEDGRVRVDLPPMPVPAKEGPARIAVRIPAPSLAPFALGEPLILTVSLAVNGRPISEERASVNLLPKPAESAAGSWTLVLADKPAQVYTTRPTLLRYIAYNPKNNPKSAKVVLKFKGDEDKVKAKWKIGISIPAGISEQILYVPSSVTSQARLKGATLLQSALMRDGTAVAKDQALVDFDLTATAAADPASGTAPLRVSFTANATGGKPPYVYNWTFGDGSAASEQNPYHNYPQIGIFTATLTVTDTLGAKVTDDLTVTVVP